MKEIISLFDTNDYKLIITTNDSGSVGKSSDFENANRLRILKKLKIPYKEVFFLNQIHSKKVVDVTKHNHSRNFLADGIISSNKKDIIAVTVADCMPIFLYDNKNDVRALLHSGRKGTGIVSEAIYKMQQQYKTKVSDITAYLGPSIKSCCYQVSEQIALQFRNDWGESATVKKGDGWYLSIDEANIKILEQIGVKYIYKSEVCTCCNNDFGSYRRDGKQNYNQMFVLSYLNQDG